MTNLPGPIAITGSNGYIGQWLQHTLKKTNTPFVNIKRETLSDSRSNWPDLPENAHVIHLAGRTDVLESWSDPDGYYEANANSTVKLLEKCRTANCSLTYLSSYSYGQPEFLPITEDHPLAAVNPYGLSKIAADEIVRFYSKYFDLNANVLRLFNVYGPNQSNLLIPTIAEQIMDESNSTISVKDLTPKRDYIYITDVISAILAVAGKGKGEAFNLGSGKSYSVKEIIEKLITHSDRKFRIESEENERRNEIPDVVADITKLQSKINWIPTVNLSLGLGFVLQNHSQPNTKLN